MEELHNEVKGIRMERQWKDKGIRMERYYQKTMENHFEVKVLYSMTRVKRKAWVSSSGDKVTSGPAGLASDKTAFLQVNT